jgi:uncharacterized membrane protein YkoI
MQKRSKVGLAIAATALAAAAGTGVAVATGVGDDENEQPITGDALDKATAAALAYTGDGRVTETEVDGESGYEVEVTLDDGSQVEVQLDENFQVVGGDEDDGSGEDD